MTDNKQPIAQYIQNVRGNFNKVIAKGNLYEIYLFPKAFWDDLKSNQFFAFVFFSSQVALFALFFTFKDLYLLSWGLWALTAFLFIPGSWGWYTWKRGEPSLLKRPFTIAVSASFVILMGLQGWKALSPLKFEGDQFGVAVADLGPNLPWRAFDENVKLSDYIFETLSTQEAPNPNIQDQSDIAFKRTGYIPNSKTAQRIGKRINADMVIWGKVIKVSGGGTVIYFEVLETPDWSDKPEFPLILPVTNTSADIFFEELDPKNDLVDLKNAVRSETEIISSFIRGYAAYLNRDFSLAANYFNQTERTIKESADSVLSPMSANGLSLLYLNLGKVYSHLGRLEEGMDWYRKAAAANPEEPAIPLSAALIYGSWGQPTERDAKLFEAQILINAWLETHTLATHPNQYNAALYNRGIISQINANYRSAVIDFKAAIKNDPQFYIANLNLGQVYRDLDDYENAEKALKSAIDVAITSGANASWAYVNLAWVYDKKGDFDAAKAAYQEAIEMNPDEMLTYFYYGEFLGKIGETDAAIHAYRNLVEKAIQAGRDIGWAHGKLAGVLYAQYLYHEAVENYEIAVHYENDNEMLLSHLAESYQQIGETEKAQTLYAKAIALEKGNYYPYASYGCFLYIKGAYDEAIENFNQSLELRPVDGKVMFYLGLTYEKLGQKEEALQTYQQIIEMQGSFEDNQDLIANVREQIKAIEANP